MEFKGHTFKKEQNFKKGNLIFKGKQFNPTINNELIQILFQLHQLYNSLIKTMEQRVKKKYIEKTAPDKNEKPKYISKQQQHVEQKIYQKPQLDNNKNEKTYYNKNEKTYYNNERAQKSQYINYDQHEKPYYKNQRGERPVDNYQRYEKPKYQVKQGDQRDRNQIPNNEQPYEQKRQPLERQAPRQQQKRDYYEKPRMLQKQSSSHYQEQSCVICSQHIKKRQFIWTCSCCYISMHLKCIKTWILNVNKDKNKNEILFTWSCPQCKFQFNQTMPKYYCFCGKFKQPEYERDIEPHSCGQICGRKRGPYCPHPCPQLCHKGKCKPCDFEGAAVSCECGKSSRIVKCSEQRQVFQCGKKCQSILNCCKHKCERNCHHGPCLPCKKKHLVTCYCKKNEDVVDCVENSYSCEQVCGKTLNCGFHTCQQQCHQGPCGNCQKTPQMQKTCPCGTYSIEMLTGDEFFRKSCEDPIPTCGMPCKKILPCGHKCSKSCHERNCSQCKIIVIQSCLCGLTTRKIECYKAHSHKQTLKCDNICKRRRSCGQHNCNTECCPHRNSSKSEDHPCQLTCPKMLNCGKHTCGENCHMGLCKKCPVIYSQHQPCPCGKTSLRPPIICGTIVPECDNVCQKQMDCGHKCMKMCHYGNCHCMEDVFVKCRCGKQQIKTVCGREALCLNKCSNLLPCGHKCGIQCHKGSCEQAHKHAPCRKLCEKQRADCGHCCGQYCHLSKKCVEFPCEAEMFIKCECGHRQTSILCGMSEQKKLKKQIKCNSRCENLKRFDVLYKGKEVYYPTNMVHFGLKNIGYVQNVEARLSKFILQSEDPVVELEYKFSDNQSKLILLNLFENHYHLNAHFYRHKKFASFTLLQTENTMIPKPTLSEYVTKITKGQIKRANLPFEYTVSFEYESKDKSELVLRTLKPYIHKYYLERKEKSIFIHFWSEEDGVKVLNALQVENPYVEFKGEHHVNDEDIEIIADTDIIETEMTQEEIQAANNLRAKEEAKRKPSEEKFEEKKKQIAEGLEQSSQQIILGKKISEQSKEETRVQKKILKTIPPPPPTVSQQVPKKKVIVTGAPKIIIKKSNLIFQAKEYPDSKQNIQDIYLIDEDEVYGQEIDWDNLIEGMASKNMGPQATQWRIRSFLMISSFNLVQQKVFRQHFEKLLKMYKKDKDRGRRILELQKLDTKVVKEEMAKDGIYLSEHEPQMLSYVMLFNYFCADKMDLELEEHHLNSQEVTQAQQILQAVEDNNFEEFYSLFKGSHYVLSCGLIPFVHAIRENTIDMLQRQQKIAVNNLYKYLLFQSQQDLIKYWKQNCVEVGVKFSKKLQQDTYYMIKKVQEDPQYIKEANGNRKVINDSRFIAESISVKRDKKYFLVEPQQLIDDQWMTRSFFAFADFKQSISNKYIFALIKSLRP